MPVNKDQFQQLALGEVMQITEQLVFAKYFSIFYRSLDCYHEPP